MKVLVLIILCFVQVDKTFSQDTIYWNAGYKLAWSDFQGKPDTLSEFTAATHATIQYSMKITGASLFTQVYCFFDRKTSWVSDKTDIGLIHEQGHFNIAELFARKLRKRFKEYKAIPATARQDLKNIFLKIKTERNAMDSLYDKETDFSRNETKQKFWTSKILNELKKFEEYK